LEYLYHYTNIDTLALILKNREIRFNRLDKVDDVSETKVFTEYDLSPYIFTSCWSSSSEESIPMWNLYTKNMTGVRLKLPKAPFKKHKWEGDAANGLTIKGDFRSIIPQKEMVTDDYFFMIPLLQEDFFCRQVEYVDNPSDYFKDFIQITHGRNGKFDLQMDSVFKLGKYKKRVWSFQEEFRYILVIFPSKSGLVEASKRADTYMELVNHMGSVTCGQFPNKIDFYDLELSDQIENIEVTLGPHCTAGDKIIVQALLREYTTGGNLHKSSLTGEIRRKK
jgi:hypothetical protein